MSQESNGSQDVDVKKSDNDTDGSGVKISKPTSLGPLFVPVSSAIIITVVAFTTVQSAPSDRPDETDRQREARQRREKYERESKQRHEEYLKKELEAFQQAKQSKDKDIAGYINAEVGLAYAYRSDHEQEKADAAFEDAYHLFVTADPELLADVRAEQLWRYLQQKNLSQAEYETRFRQLFKASAYRPAQEFDRQVSDAITYGARFGSSSDADTRKKLARIAIELATSTFGANSAHLYPLVLIYASSCESSGDIAEAEKQYLRADSLLSDRSVDSKLDQQFRLAQFYLRHNMLDKAQAAYDAGEKLCGGLVSQNQARTFAYYLEQYRKYASGADVDRLVSRMLAMGGDGMCRELDPKLQSIVDGYIDSGALKKAELLLRKRVKASDTCTTDLMANDWRMKLSDVLLALGQESQSNQIYNEVKGAVALQGGSVDYLIQQRAALLARLGKTAEITEQKKQSPQPNVPVTLKYGMLAYDMRFGHNTTISSFNSAQRGRSMFGSDVDICSLGLVQKEGNFSCFGRFYVNGNLHQNLLPPNMVQRRAAQPPSFLPLRPDSGSSLPPLPPPPPPPKPPAMMFGRGRGETLPVNPKDVVVAAAISPPASAVDLTSSTVQSGSKPLEPGDYIVNDLRGVLNRVRPGKDQGRIRLFLKDTPVTSGLSIAEWEISNYSMSPYANPGNLQIWYSGTRPLKVRQLTALLYAPNASVEFVLNGSFSGAIVARRIVGEGNNRYSLDASLVGKNFSTNE